MKRTPHPLADHTTQVRDRHGMPVQGEPASKQYDDPIPLVLKSICAYFRFTTKQVAQILGVPREAVDRWAIGYEEPVGPNKQEVYRIQRLMELLIDRKGRQAQDWLRTSNAAFGGSTPLQILLTQGPRHVAAYISDPEAD